jgi:predicted HicB family RNase H-like nuclease
MKQEKPAEEIIKTTLRLPRSLSDAVRHQAINEKCKLQELVERALRSYLKQKGVRL